MLRHTAISNGCLVYYIADTYSTLDLISSSRNSPFERENLFPGKPFPRQKVNKYPDANEATIFFIFFSCDFLAIYICEIDFESFKCETIK